jgi:hypothetical protein
LFITCRAELTIKPRGVPFTPKYRHSAVPIASITKLMTSMVVLETDKVMDEPIVIEQADVDTIKIPFRVSPLEPYSA